MFKKIVKNLEPSSTLKINEISKELEKSGKEIFKFGFGQSPFEIPTSIVDALRDNVDLLSKTSVVRIIFPFLTSRELFDLFMYELI